MTKDDLWPLACPGCKGPLTAAGLQLRCHRCDSSFGRGDSGCWDFRRGHSFEDWFGRDDVSRRSFEDHAGRIEDIGSRRVVREFLAPLMSRLALHPGESVVLSDGCGRGADVEELRGLGFESWGVDPGLRSEEWSRRVCTEYLLHGDGTDLPFASAIFDFVFSEGVIEHVGLSGDHNLPAEISKHDKLERDRIAYCDEIYRVLKPGGYALIGGPNRLFPIDFFHGGRPFLGLCFRFHSFRERFLASASDVRTWFGESVTVKSISLDGFFNMSLL